MCLRCESGLDEQAIKWAEKFDSWNPPKSLAEPMRAFLKRLVDYFKPKPIPRNPLIIEPIVLYRTSLHWTNKLQWQFERRTKFYCKVIAKHKFGTRKRNEYWNDTKCVRCNKYQYSSGRNSLAMVNFTPKSVGVLYNL